MKESAAISERRRRYLADSNPDENRLTLYLLDLSALEQQGWKKCVSMRHLAWESSDKVNETGESVLQTGIPQATISKNLKNHNVVYFRYFNFVVARSDSALDDELLGRLKYEWEKEVSRLSSSSFSSSTNQRKKRGSAFLSSRSTQYRRQRIRVDNEEQEQPQQLPLPPQQQQQQQQREELNSPVADVEFPRFGAPSDSTHRTLSWVDGFESESRRNEGDFVVNYFGSVPRVAPMPLLDFSFNTVGSGSYASTLTSSSSERLQSDHSDHNANLSHLAIPAVAGVGDEEEEQQQQQQQQQPKPQQQHRKKAWWLIFAAFLFVAAFSIVLLLRIDQNSLEAVRMLRLKKEEMKWKDERDQIIQELTRLSEDHRTLLIDDQLLRTQLQAALQDNAKLSDLAETTAEQAVELQQAVERIYKDNLICRSENEKLQQLKDSAKLFFYQLLSEEDDK